MANPILWSNVGVDVQTAASAAVPITSISRAAVGVATYTGVVNPSLGDCVALSANGMQQVNDRLFRVSSVNTAAKTFEIEGEDTTLYDAFTGGSFQVITYGASFGTVQQVQISGGDYEKADLTTIHDSVRKQVPTIAQPMTVALTNFFDLADPGFIECVKAYKSKTRRAFRLRFVGGAKIFFSGYVGASGIPTGQAQGIVQTAVSIDAQNLPTVYAS